MQNILRLLEKETLWMNEWMNEWTRQTERLGTFTQQLLPWINNMYYIFWVCVCSLRYPACKRIRRIIMSSVACLPVPHISTLYHKRHDFRGEKELNIKCVFWFSLQILSEILLIIRRFNGDTVTGYVGLRGPYPLFVLHVNETWIFSTDFSRILKRQVSWTSVQ
jgi:hypothetical protein